MPIMDGVSATKAICQWEQQTQKPITPIVALTAHAIQEELQKSLDAGYTDYLTKPLKKAELANKLEVILNQSLDVEPSSKSFVPSSKYIVIVPKVFADLMEGILKNKRSQCQQLFEASENQDFEKIKWLGHQLHGSHNMDRVNEIGHLLEKAATQQDSEAIQSLLSELQDFLDHVEFQAT